MIKGKGCIITALICSVVVLSACGNTKDTIGNAQETTGQAESTVFSSKQGENSIDGTKEIIEERKTTENKALESKDLESIDVSKSQFEKGYYDYEGTINNDISIEMSIYQLEKEIVGTYLYKTEGKKIKLEGKAGEKDIILYEYDENGKNTGVFKGIMDTVDKIEGTWISGDNTKEYPFTLSLKSILPGAEYGKRYGVALGTKNDQDVENFVNEVRRNVINNNKEKLSEKIAYPITVKIDDKAVKIENKDEFIKNYNKIFHNGFKNQICDASTKYLFANSKGIMFGEGLYNMWINEIIPDSGDSKLAITAINN